MGKRGDQLTRTRVPEFGGFVRACCEDPSTIRAKRHSPDDILMSEGGDEIPEPAFQSLAVLSALAVRIEQHPG